MRRVALYVYGGVLTGADVVLRLPQRSLEIMTRAKDLSGKLDIVGKRRTVGTF